MSAASPGVRIAMAWCAAYTALLPESDRARRREELHAHLLDAQHGGQRAARIVLLTVRGAPADLRFVGRARRRAGVGSALLAPYERWDVAVAVSMGFVATILAVDPMREILLFAILGRAAGVGLCAAFAISVAGLSRRWRRAP